MMKQTRTVGYGEGFCRGIAADVLGTAANTTIVSIATCNRWPFSGDASKPQLGFTASTSAKKAPTDLRMSREKGRPLLFPVLHNLDRGTLVVLCCLS